MSKNNTEYSLVGFDIPLIAEFNGYRNNAHHVIILINIEKLDGEFILGAPAHIRRQVVG